MRTALYSTAGMAALLMACGPDMARAQAATAAPAPANAISEVIVTAQKRSEKLSTVPLSITAITANQLNSSASKTLVELQGTVPGVTFPQPTAYGGAPIVIRGTSGQGTFLEDDPVAVYVDGIYQASNSRFGVSDLTDVQSVEIVRGPQGTLQGRNATAGAILVRTEDPGATFGGFARASVAAPMEYRVEAAVSLPMGDTFGARISGDYFDQDGWAKNLFDGSRLGGEKAGNIRAVFLWKPAPSFSARLAINYQTLIGTQASARWAYTTVNPSGQAVTQPTPYVSLPASVQNAILNGNQVDLNQRSENTQRAPTGALELHYDFGKLELVSLSGLSRATNDGRSDSDGLDAMGTNGVSLKDAVTGNVRQAYNTAHITGSQFTQELRLQSNSDSAFRWLIGVFDSHAVDDMDFKIYNLNESSALNQITGFVAHQVDNSQAAFVDATYKLTQRLSLTGGIRYTAEDKQFNNKFSLTNFNSGAVFVGPISNAPPKGSWNDVSYRANLNYQATEDLMAYASYSKGFKSGGYNAFGVGAAPSFNPETLYSAEVGLKSYFLAHRGYIAASVYDNSYNNLQVTSGVPSGGVIIHNAASATIKGFEAEGQFRPMDRLLFNANASYTDAKYDSFKNAQGVGGELLDASGNALPNTPRWQYFVTGEYRVDITSGWTAAAQLSWRWRDKVFFFGTNENANLQGAEDGELGGRVDLINYGSGLTLSVYGKNLNNRRVVNSEQVNFGYPVAFFNQPRVVGVQASKRF